ncbi:hypothetical protein NC651_007214 [Populus alba x Populus x berolinensis]|nr:hypothetical protein NC651_007214 [Populus alba x Populus x berolinensis]
MGSTQSAQAAQDDDEEEEASEEEEEKDEEDEEEELEQPNDRGIIKNNNNLHNKVLQQEPEMLPCYASASPLSPQLSSLGTPKLGPSIKVWDPYNVLAPLPPPPPPPLFSDDEVAVLEVFFISHGECELDLRPDLVGGRCHVAELTPKGQRQARALAVFFNSQRVSFHSVYSSPLNRARSMAVSVCQEMNFAEEQIRPADALMEMSMGLWEGCSRSEIYTPEVQSLLENFQPDFCAPSGESLRQVEFRMVQFLNGTVLGLPEKLRSDLLMHHQTESQGFSHDRDGPHWDMLHRHRPGLARKKSGKSRLQHVNSTGNHEGEGEVSLREAGHQHVLPDLNNRNSSSPVSSCVGVFTHSIPIKCLLTGLLGCSPAMMNKICIEDSSVTVLQHSWKTGWQIKRLNDTAHLRLL